MEEPDPAPGPSLKRVAVYRNRVLALALALSSVVLAGQQAPPTGPPAAPQQPDPQMPPITFRSEVNYVEVDAAVRDAQGNFVRDLRQGDFQVLEDGVPQTGDGVLAGRHPHRAVRARAVPARGHRSGREVERQRARGPAVRAAPRRHPHQRHALDARAPGREAVHRSQPRRERPGGGHPHERPERRRAGLHQQPPPAHAGGGQVHGPQAALADAQQDRQLQPDARGRPGGDHRRRRAGRADAQRPVDAHDAAEPVGMAGRHPRPEEGRGLRQRGHRLQHLGQLGLLEHVRQRRQHRGPRRRLAARERDARRHGRRHAGQRQHLRHRSAGALLSGRRGHADLGAPDRRGGAGPRRVRAPGRAAPLAGHAARRLGGDRRLRVRLEQRLHQRVPAHRRRQQHVLRPRVLLDQRKTRRPLSQDRGQADPARAERQRPEGLRGGQGHGPPSRSPSKPAPGRPRSCARRSTARSRSPA